MLCVVEKQKIAERESMFSSWTKLVQIDQFGNHLKKKKERFTTSDTELKALEERDVVENVSTPSII